MADTWCSVCAGSHERGFDCVTPDKTTCAIDLVERVARAIYESIFADEWVGGKGIEAEQYRQAARAAIEAQSDTITRLQAALDEMRANLVEEREENLWNAYNSGAVRDGRWTHMFMSDGEWLARQCGFDSREADYDDAEIRAAIPKAALSSVGGE